MSDYKKIVQHYEECLHTYGDSFRGVDWPNQADAILRYKVMLDVMYEKTGSLLDFGCGAAHLYQFIQENGYEDIQYIGFDISSDFIKLCQKKYPKEKFICGDILADAHVQIPQVDYIVFNGVFTEKLNLTFGKMEEYFQSILCKAYPFAKKGLAFNVMSKLVDWERTDLFHMPLDQLSQFIAKNLSRNFVIRNDYGLYEYTVYVYKKSIKDR